jgi:hypothetical protein
MLAERLVRLNIGKQSINDNQIRIRLVHHV